MLTLVLALAAAAAAPAPSTAKAVHQHPLAAPSAVEPVKAAPIGYLTAAELAERCTSSGSATSSSCFAFIAGVHDTVQAYELWLNQREFCIPAGTPQADLRRVFLAYLVAHPVNRSGEAASVVVVALKETYPCLAVLPRR